MASSDDELFRYFNSSPEAIRSLIDEVRLVPKGGELKIELFGELGALFERANEHPRSKEAGVQVTLVAGARNHLYRTELRWTRKTAQR